MKAAVGEAPALQAGLLLPFDFRQAAVERDPVVAAVELLFLLGRRDRCDRIGHLRFGHQVAPPELDAIDAEILRRHVEQPLAEEIALEPSRSPVGADRILVCQHHRGLHVDVRDAVGAGEELRDVARRDGGARAQVRAGVDPRAAAQGKDRPILLAGNLDLAIGLARVIRAEQVLASVLDPFHRPVELARRERNQVVLGIELAAHAEAAADIGLNHVDAFLGQVHALRKNPPVGERHLGRSRNRHLGVRSIPDGQQAPRLHAHGGVPLHAEGFPTHIGRRIFRKRLI